MAFPRKSGPQMGPKPSEGPNPNYLGPSDSSMSFPDKAAAKGSKKPPMKKGAPFGGKKAAPFTKGKGKR